MEAYMNRDEISALFKLKQIKNTKQRLCVYGILLSADQPMTAEAIYLALSGSDADAQRLNLSTVYRILDLFVKEDLVVRNSFSKDYKATYEVATQTHKHHLICVKCHHVTVIEGCPLEKYEKTLVKSTHFQIIEHKLEIHGICPKCQN